MPETLQDDWIETALKVTGHFEDSADPMGAVTGDFDGMGISLGVLQWNIGKGSLQPLVRRIGRAVVVETMPSYGVELWTACNETVTKGLAIVRSWQSGATLRQPVFKELKAFVHGDLFSAAQIGGARKVAANALDTAQKWAVDDPVFANAVTKGQFCWFFDILTQNGGLGHLTYSDVVNFLNGHGAGSAVETICDWLAARTSADAGFKDSRKNADLWRDTVDDAHTSLFVLSYLRALNSRLPYRGDVLNRKATVALGRGWVHAEQQNLRAFLQN